MDKAAQQVLEQLARHGDDLQAVLADDELNRSLDAFREDLPRLVRCPAEGCRGKVVHIAVDPHAPAVIGKRTGAMSEELLAKHRRDQQLPSTIAAEGLPALYQHWSVAFGRRTVGEAVDPGLDPNHELRWIVTCPKPKCGRRYLVTNTGLLALLVARISRGSGDVTLPAGCELSPAEELSVREQSR